MSESTSQKKKISRDTAESMSGSCEGKGRRQKEEGDKPTTQNQQPTTNKKHNNHKESKKGRMADALAHGGEEGRDKLR